MRHTTKARNRKGTNGTGRLSTCEHTLLAVGARREKATHNEDGADPKNRRRRKVSKRSQKTPEAGILCSSRGTAPR